MSENYYKVLGVSENASFDEIKKSFRKLSLKHHPDKKGGDVNIFKKINEAYETISDNEKRKNYDNKLKYGNNVKNFGNEPFFSTGSGMPGIPEEILRHMFGGGGIPSGHFSINMNGNPNGNNVRIFRNGKQVNIGIQKPILITQSINITSEESYTGCCKPIEIERWVQDDETTRRVEKETLYIDIQEGIDNNETIIIKNKGNITSDVNKGDIRIIIKINNNTELKREGLNLFYHKKLSLKESLCGFSFTINHLNGKEYLINNENTIISPNYKKVIEGLGMKRNSRNGNLYIVFDIDFPRSFTKEQTKKLKEIL